MALARREETPSVWNPWRELQEMSSRIDRLFSGHFLGANGEETLTPTMGWVPTVNVSENDDVYAISAELPAIKKEDLHVKMD